MTAPAGQMELTYAEEDVPIAQFVLRDDRPEAPYMTPTQARAVIRWHEQGLALIRRWHLLYGAEDAPEDAKALLKQARQMIGQG